jgi:hypothetical protein
VKDDDGGGGGGNRKERKTTSSVYISGGVKERKRGKKGSALKVYRKGGDCVLGNDSFKAALFCCDVVVSYSCCRKW